MEEKVYNDIIDIIKENLWILMNNQDLCLNYIIEYCKDEKNKNKIIDQSVITKFTEDALSALLNANFLYDFRNIE